MNQNLENKSMSPKDGGYPSVEADSTDDTPKEVQLVYEEGEHPPTEAEMRTVLWKIDLIVLPVLFWVVSQSASLKCAGVMLKNILSSSICAPYLPELPQFCGQVNFIVCKFTWYTAIPWTTRQTICQCRHL